MQQEVLEIRNREGAKSLVGGTPTCPLSKYLRTCYVPDTLPGIGDRSVSKRPEGGEGAGWRDHSEASQSWAEETTSAWWVREHQRGWGGASVGVQQV